MKEENKVPSTTDLAPVPDSLLFEEVANRLRRIYRKSHGIEFLYGCFAFIFHEGRFQGVEEKPRFRFYKSRDGLVAL